MPTVETKEGEKNSIILTITVTDEEARPMLEEAARALSKQKAVPGFRPGHATYEAAKQHLGEMAVYEAALEGIISKAYLEALDSEKIDPVGHPHISVEKLAPGNDIVFTAEVSRLPKVTRLAAWKKIKIKARKPEVADKELDVALRDIQRMQTKETRAKEGSASEGTDKMVVAMDMRKDGVSVEGGSSPNHIILLGEDHYIPGLTKEVGGMKEGDKRSFSLPFPKEHPNKTLAGADVQFDVELKELFNLSAPELDDEFAKSLGQESMDKLKDLLRANLMSEKEGEAKAGEEREMLEAIAEKSRFEDIPDLLLNQEIMKMIQELQRGVEEQGGEFDNYLKSLGKTIGALKMEFAPQALLRIKVALILRAIADEEKIEVDQKELDDELDKVAAQIGNEEARKQVFSPAYRERAESVMRNRKVIELLRSEMVK